MTVSRCQRQAYLLKEWGRALIQSPRISCEGGLPPDLCGASFVCIHKRHTLTPSVITKVAVLPHPPLPRLGT